MRRIALTTAAAICLAAAAAAADLPREIVVTGEGRVEVVPDMATVSAGVESQADTAAAALEENGEAMRAVLAALAAAGIPPADIQTSRLGLDPVYRPHNDGRDWTPEVVGYVARNTLTVRIRDVETVGRVIDAVSEAGVNRIEGIGFGLADTRPTLDAAREAAVRDGREKAGLFARAAGVGLGAVLSIRETQPLDRPFPMAARAEMAMDGAIAEGTVEVTAMVEIVFALDTEPGEDDGRDGGRDGEPGDGGDGNGSEGEPGR